METHPEGQVRRGNIIAAMQLSPINALQLLPLMCAHVVPRKRAAQSFESKKRAQVIADSQLTKRLNKIARDREIRRLCVSDNSTVADQSSSSSALPYNYVAYGFGFLNDKEINNVYFIVFSTKQNILLTMQASSLGNIKPHPMPNHTYHEAPPVQTFVIFKHFCKTHSRKHNLKENTNIFYSKHVQQQVGVIAT